MISEVEEQEGDSTSCLPSDTTENPGMGLIFEDPISFELMENAVITPCGHSFSESTLTEWTNTHDECPICSAKFSRSDIKPNYKLREIISKYKKLKAQRDKQRRATCATDTLKKRGLSSTGMGTGSRSQTFNQTTSSANFNLSDWDASDSDEDDENQPVLIVDVLKGKDFPNRSFMGRIDPYCILNIGDSQRQTRPVKRSPNPKWSESFIFRLKEDSKQFMFELSVFTGNKALGSINVLVADVIRAKKICKWFSLHHKVKPDTRRKKSSIRKKGTRGEVKLRFRYLASLSPREESFQLTPRTEALAEEYCAMGSLKASRVTEEEMREEIERRNRERGDGDSRSEGDGTRVNLVEENSAGGGNDEEVQHDMEEDPVAGSRRRRGEGREGGAIEDEAVEEVAQEGNEDEGPSSSGGAVDVEELEPLSNVLPNEDGINRLMAHGVARDMAIHALQASNHDLVPTSSHL